MSQPICKECLKLNEQIKEQGEQIENLKDIVRALSAELRKEIDRNSIKTS